MNEYGWSLPSVHLRPQMPTLNADRKQGKGWKESENGLDGNEAVIFPRKARGKAVKEQIQLHLYSS